MDPQTPLQEAPVENAHLPNKKVIIIGFSVLAVIVVFVLITVLTSSSDKQQNPVQPVTRQNPGNSDTSNPNSSFPVVSAPAENWNTYQTSKFSISYPPDWKTEEFTLGSGSGVYLQPVGAVKGPLTTSMTITLENVSSSATVRQRQLSYVNFGFKNDFITLDNNQASRLKGIFPPVSNTASQSATTRAVQETHLFLDKDPNSYVFIYKYEGKSVNQADEVLFSKMISSFKFN